MKLCIPTMDDSGLAGVPSAHFGSAPFFTFVDTETRTVEAIPNSGYEHAHGACRPLDFLGSRPVDAFVCRGMGRRALARLNSAGVNVLVTLEESVEKTLEALQAGRLQEMSVNDACQGHGHGHSHAHGHGRGGCN